MSFQLFRILGLLASSFVVAAVTGYAIATQNYNLILMLVAGALFLTAILSPGYAALLSLGLLSPFSVPLPFIWGLPPVGLALGTCMLKRALRRGLIQGRIERPVSAMIPAFWVFFAGVFMRYCINPVMPNATGFGENITGFRPYLNYGICFGLVVLIGHFVRSRADLGRTIRWLAWLSVFFIVLLAPLMFTRSMGVASALSYFGLYVTTFENGILRFVALPFFGIILVSLALLPRLFETGKTARGFMLCLGIAAVLLGGNRSGLAMMTAVIIVIPLLQRDFRRFALIISAMVFFYIGAYFAGETLSRRDAGVLRALALVSPQLAESTRSTGTWEFRELRWRRALMEIQNRPFIGRGYGGVQNAFIWTDWYTFDEARVEIDLASGGIHNGYLACALAFGIPAALLFIGILLWAIWRNARLAMYGQDSFSRNIHAFVCVNLIAYALTIYIGTDLNNPMIWFFLALGVLAQRITRAETLSNLATPQPAAVFNRRAALA